MKTFKIPVVWEMCGYVEVTADTLEDAKEKALNAPLPIGEDAEYVDGSFEINEGQLEAELDI